MMAVPGIDPRFRLLGRKRPALATYVSKAEDASTTDVYTFASQDTGAAADGGEAIVCISAYPSNVTGRTATVTVGGEAVSAVVTQNADNYSWCAIFKGEVSVAGEQSIVVTFSGNMGACAVDVYRSAGAAAAASDTGSDYGSAKNPLSDTGATCPEKGYIVAVAMNTDSPPRTNTWAGVDEDTDAEMWAASYHTSAHKNFDTEQSGLTVSATFSSTPDNATMAWCAFGQA